MSKNDTLIVNHSSTIQSVNPNSMTFNRIIWMLAAFSFLAGGAFVLGRYFCQPKKATQDPKEALQEAIDRCQEEADNQYFEAMVIFDAINEFNQQSQSYINQNKERLRVAGYGWFPVANEHTALIETREQVEIKQQQQELIELAEHYPESGYAENPCIETVESYREARKAHHRKMVSLATVLLPNLGALMAAARQDTSMKSGLK